VTAGTGDRKGRPYTTMRFLRPAMILATVVVSAAAVLLLAGRIVFGQLPRLEGVVNELLSGQGIEVQGLEGRWRGVNPGFFAERIRFPSGEVVGFDFELDLLESLGRNRVVARRLTIADGRVTIERGDSGWHLKGARGEATGFPASDLLIHSDEVWVRGRLVAEADGRVAPLYVESALINTDGQHRSNIRVQSESNCAGCALEVSADIASGGRGVIRLSAESFTLGAELAEILGIPDFEATLAGDWYRTDAGEARARLMVEIAGLKMPGAPVHVDALLHAWNERRGYRGSIKQFAVLAGDRETNLAGGGFRIDRAELGAEAPFAEFWLPKLPLAEIAGVIVAAAGVEHPAGRWLDNLSPVGELESFVARVDDRGIAFAYTGSGGALYAYNGMPEVDNTSFEIAGHARALRASLKATNFRLAFPDFVAAAGIHDQGGGVLTVVRGTNHVGVRGDMRLSKAGATVLGGFALARSWGTDDAVITADGVVDRVDASLARDYLPLNLDPELRQWLLDSLQAGELAGNRLLYHGDVKPTPGSTTRRFEMSANVEGGRVRYHADWPTADRVAGVLTVTGPETRFAGSARVFDAPVTGLTVRVPSKGKRVAVRLVTETTVDRLIDFAWQTPVHEAMPFLSEDWVGTGRASVFADLSLPLGGEELRPADMRLDFAFSDASIDLVDLGLHIDAMDNQVGFEWPAVVASDASEGTLFGAPVRIAIDSEDDRVTFSLDGTATPADAYRLLEIADPGIADGRFAYSATFTVFPGSDRASELEVSSDLAGVNVALPQPLGKLAEQSREFTAGLQFLDEYTAVSVRYGAASGWIHAGEEGIRAAALGIGGPVPMADAGAGRVVIGGRLESVQGADIASFIDGLAGADQASPDHTESAGRQLAWELRRFRIDKVVLDAWELDDLEIDGRSVGGDVSFAIASPALNGTVGRSGNEPWQVRLSEVRLEAADGEGDPFDPVLIDSLVAADVVVDHIEVGEVDYGTWRLGLRPHAYGVEIVDVVADVRGLHIETGAPAFWSRRGETFFDGTVTAGDLQHVLPLWDFAPTVESESFRSTGVLRWPGSPLNFELGHLSGDATLELTNGRFLDVEQGAGAMRIMSLINFSTIVKRMSLDFSDIFGRGVSFDRVTAGLAVDEGLARFVEPARITGTGSRFEISGYVDLESGALDNEMVVTLPLHKSLPWYAAVLAISNPVAAAGVLFGQQVFREPIERLSSGLYRVGGTLEEPDVEFMSIFENEVGQATDTPTGSGTERGTADARLSGDRAPGGPTRDPTRVVSGGVASRGDGAPPNTDPETNRPREEP